MKYTIQLEIVKQKIARTLLMGLPALAAIGGAPVSLAASATQPNIVNVQLKSGAAFINGGGNVGEIYYLQATTNLTDPTAWMTIGTNTADLQGQWQFTDCSASNCPMRFYRLFRQSLPNHVTTPLFPMGMLAKGGISFSSHVLLDSFDSGNPNYSTGGQYDPAKASDNCVLGTISDSPTAISAGGGALIKGTVHTGPTGVVNLGGSSSVGDAAWVNGGNMGIESGHWLKDMTMVFPDVVAPQGAGAPPAAGSYQGTNYTYVLSGSHSFYQMSALNLSGSQKMIITGTNVTLYVTGDVAVSGSASISFAPGASLAMYVGGANCSLSGHGVVNGGNALQFQYYGLSSNTSFICSSGVTFVGTIYAPEADFSLSGTEYIGASVTKTVTMQGGGNFHFDENVRNAGPLAGFVTGNSTEIATP
jgi:hypothetical protein